MGRTREPRTLRIIAGTWRGRRFRFPDVPDIRPTPDRVRETLFNWLQRDIGGATCLDLFAGSGALGLEALSRGAGWVTFVDRDTRVTAHLRHQLDTLKIANATVVHSSAQEFLRRSERIFDVVFLDPPFHSADAQVAVETLATQHAVAHRGWVYLELATRAPLPAVPPGWVIHRDGRAGQVHSVLFRCGGENTPDTGEYE